MSEQTRGQKVADRATTSAWTLLVSGAGFFILEARHHVTREEFQKHLDDTAPMIRQMDESRGRVEARLGAIEERLGELVRALEAERAHQPPR